MPKTNPQSKTRANIGRVADFTNSNQLTKTGRLSCLLWLVLAAGLTWAATQPAQAQNSIQYNFKQSQTKLSVTVESSQNISSSHWPYAGPLNNRSECSNSNFPNLDEDLKGQAALTKLGAKKARAEIDISRSDNNKLYCFIIDGFPTVRRVDYNPPIIEFGDRTNLIKARDEYKGSYGPNGNVDSKSWQAAVFDAGRAGNSYGCNADNQELVFKPVSSDAKHISQYSWGNTNHLSYNLPDHKQSLIEFYEKFKELVYASEETNPALIPFIDGDWNPDFSDNIHLCHRVSDPQGNTSYKLMRLDFAGPVIKLQFDGQSIQASSPAVDLDDSTWQYMATDQRHIRSSCELIKDFTSPSGESATVETATSGHYYCFLVADKQGNIGRAWIKADPNQAQTSPPPENNDNQQQAQQPSDNQPDPNSNPQPPPENNQQLTGDQAPSPGQTNAEAINDQAANVAEADPAQSQPTGDEPQTTPDESHPDQPQPANQPLEAEQQTPLAKQQPDEENPDTGSSLLWPIILALAVFLLVIGGSLVVVRLKKQPPTDK